MKRKKKVKPKSVFQPKQKGNFITIKTSLKSILKDYENNFQKINEIVLECNEIVIQTYQFIRLYLLDCYYKNKDRYKRIIAKCFSHINKKKERLNLNYMMVRNGHAIDYKRYSKGEYSQAENIAKKERVGIWSGKFERPEDWRRKYK